MLWGSQARGTAHERSDVDVCVVAGPHADLEAALSAARAAIHVPGERVEIRLFEDLPLYLQGAVIEDDTPVWTSDAVALYEYLRPYRRRWDDQKHRANVPLDDLRRALAGG